MSGRVRVVANRPRITGPGLAGPGFYTGGCTRT